MILKCIRHRHFDFGKHLLQRFNVVFRRYFLNYESVCVIWHVLVHRRERE